MSTEEPWLISEKNLSIAWARAFLGAMERTDKSFAPLTISIGGFSGAPAEDPEIQDIVDAGLAQYKDHIFSCAVSASTIFPWKLWKMEGFPSCEILTDKYLSEILPRWKARGSAHNKYGTYFERMVSFGPANGPVPVVNQLAFIIKLWKGSVKQGWRPRQSAMVVSCIDPMKDHTKQRVRGFPCLQQVSFGRDNAGGLSVSAYYPTQYIFDRAYGNYLGLGQLGQFMASQLKLKLVRLNIFIGRPELGSVGKTALKGVAVALRKRLGEIR